MTVAGDILRHAADIVDGPRNTQHGDKERSFTAIADFWECYLKHRSAKFIKSTRYVPLNGSDVAAMMVLLKLARSLYGEPIPDHFTDMAGYSAILGELEAEFPNEAAAKSDDYNPTVAANHERMVGPARMR